MEISVWRAPGGVEAGNSLFSPAPGPMSLLCVCWAGTGDMRPPLASVDSVKNGVCVF